MRPIEIPTIRNDLLQCALLVRQKDPVDRNEIGITARRFAMLLYKYANGTFYQELMNELHELLQGNNGGKEKEFMEWFNE